MHALYAQMDSLLAGLADGNLPQAEGDREVDMGWEDLDTEVAPRPPARQSEAKKLLPPPVRAIEYEEEKHDLSGGGLVGSAWDDDWMNEEATSERAAPSQAVLDALYSRAPTPEDTGEEAEARSKKRRSRQRKGKGRAAAKADAARRAPVRAQPELLPPPVLLADAATPAQPREMQKTDTQGNSARAAVRAKARKALQLGRSQDAATDRSIASEMTDEEGVKPPSQRPVASKQRGTSLADLKPFRRASRTSAAARCALLHARRGYAYVAHLSLCSSA